MPAAVPTPTTSTPLHITHSGTQLPALVITGSAADCAQTPRNSFPDAAVQHQVLQPTATSSLLAIAGVSSRAAGCLQGTARDVRPGTAGHAAISSSSLAAPNARQLQAALLINRQMPAAGLKPHTNHAVRSTCSLGTPQLPV
jgi:hypothetical protein